MLDRVAAPLPSLDEAMGQTAMRIDALFAEAVALPDDPSRRLAEAMRYAAIGGGKRLRPLLVLAGAGLFDVAQAQALRAGLAVECIHVHSLVHDDLPCMDDDDLRRGRATVHLAFDEATAVLAGDALLALAFELLSAPETHPNPLIRSELVLELARAAGAGGMAGGQMLDLVAEAGGDLCLDSITRLQRLKTGALITWSVMAGAVMGDAPAEARSSLRGYAHCLGLAFQIADDLLDAEGEEEKAGKRLRKDEGQGKQTFVSLLGRDRAREQAQLLAEQACDHLRCFGDGADLLRQIARFSVERDR
jgi:farnesyl diphosphate synthase